MTLRLVAVMSVVLLLCLGAFGLIANHFQDMPVGLGCHMELVFRHLYAGQAGCCQDVRIEVPRCLADRYGFSIGPGGRGPLSLSLVGNPQLPGSRSAVCQVVGMQILQGTARLGNDGFYIMLTDSHHGPQGGNMSYKVLDLVVCLGTIQSCFSSL